MAWESKTSLEALVLVADDNSIVGNPQGVLRGTVIEAEVDRSRGTMATLLVMNGTMKRGDVIVAGVVLRQGQSHV